MELLQTWLVLAALMFVLVGISVWPTVARIIPQPRIDKKEVRNGVGLLVTLVGFSITQGLVLIVSEEGKGVRGSAIAIYCVVAIATLASEWQVVRSRKRVRRSFRRTYDRATIEYGNYAMACTVLISAFFVGLGLFGRLPGQEIKGEDIHDYHWEFDDSGGIRVVRTLTETTEDSFDNRIPTSLIMHVYLDAPLAGNWEVTKVKGYYDVARDRQMSEGPSHLPASSNESEWQGQLFDLSRDRYFFDIYLHNKTDVIERSEARRAIENGALRVRFLPPPE